MQSLNDAQPSPSNPITKLPKPRRPNLAQPVSPNAECTEEEKNLLPPYISPGKPGTEQVMVIVQELLEEPIISEGISKPQVGTEPQDSIISRL